MLVKYCWGLAPVCKYHFDLKVSRFRACVSDIIAHIGLLGQPSARPTLENVCSVRFGGNTMCLSARVRITRRPFTSGKLSRALSIRKGPALSPLSCGLTRFANGRRE